MGKGRGRMEPKLAKQLANPMLVRRGELWPVQDGERGGEGHGTAGKARRPCNEQFQPKQIDDLQKEFNHKK